MIDLSIIVPFYNSAHKSLKILTTLPKVADESIEIIFVDDGSTDSTPSLLLDFKERVLNDVHIITQNNKGPGGARNAGLKIAKGKYVWFVDSDDDITLEAIDFIKKNSIKNYDLINFNYLRKGVMMSGVDVAPGSYDNEHEVRKILLRGFGPLWSNVYKRKMLIQHNIYYPEYCYYEDNPLTFIYPFFVKSLLNTNTIAYIYNEECDSIVRSKPSLRTLDRLYTAEYGLKRGLNYATKDSEADTLKMKFIDLYLINSVRTFLTKKPNNHWITTWRIMKSYRVKARKMNINSNILDTLESKGYSNKYKLFFFSHWLVSYFLPNNQEKYFQNVRNRAWDLNQ